MTRSASGNTAWSVMTVFVVLEAVAGLVLTAQTISAFLSRGEDDILAALSIVIVVILALVWVIVTAIGALKRRRWSRSSAVTIQIFIAAIAVGAFQGFYAQPAIGWALLAPALVTLIAALRAAPHGNADADQPLPSED